MGQLVLTDKGKFEKTKGTRGKPGRYLVEIELENIYKQNAWLLGLDEDYFDKLIKDGVPNQISAEFFINWIINQIKDADTSLKKFEGGDDEKIKLSIARWIFYKRLSSCVTVVNSLLDAYKFNRTCKAEVKRILKEYKYLYKENKPEERELKKAHDEALLINKSPYLESKKKELLRVLEGLIEAHGEVMNTPEEGEEMVECDTQEQFLHITKCLYHILNPIVDEELKQYSKSRLANADLDKDTNLFYLQRLGDEFRFTRVVRRETIFNDYGENNYHEEKAFISTYKNILDSLSIESLDKLFSKLQVAIDGRTAFIKCDERPKLFSNKKVYDTVSMSKEEKIFHRSDRFRKISMFDEDYEEIEAKRREMNENFPPINISNIFSVNGEKLIEGKPEDEQFFLPKQSKSILLQ